MFRNCSAADTGLKIFFEFLITHGVNSFTLKEISEIFNHQQRTMKGYLTHYMRNYNGPHDIKLNTSPDDSTIYILLTAKGDLQ